MRFKLFRLDLLHFIIKSPRVGAMGIKLTKALMFHKDKFKQTRQRFKNELFKGQH